MRKMRVHILLLALVLLLPAFVLHPEQPDVPVMALSGHGDAVTALAWSPDSSILASSAGEWDSTDYTARLWAKDGSLIAVLDEFTSPVVSLDWSPDGSVLAAGSEDEIRLWSPDGTLLNTVEVDRGTVFTLDWSPDGSLLASASLAGTRRNTVQVWSAEGELLETLPTQYSGGKFLNAGWSPDGQYLVGGALDYWEWQADGTHVFTHKSGEYSTPNWGFAWSPDSSMWGIGNESGVVWVYSVEGEELGYLRNNAGNVDVMAWSPDGSRLLTGNALWEWMGETFQQRSSIGGGRIRTISWSPDSTVIAAAPVNQPNISLWNTRGERIGILEGHESKVEQVLWSPDGTVLASSSNDRTVRLWDVSGLLATLP